MQWDYLSREIISQASSKDTLNFKILSFIMDLI